MSRWIGLGALCLLVGAVLWTGGSGKAPLHNENPDGWMPTPRSPAYFGDPVKSRLDWYLYQRAYPLDRIPAGARVRALRHAESIAEFRRGAEKAGPDSPWTLVGPVGFDSAVEPTWGRMSGRVRALAIDPNNSNRLYLGTATGGLWRSDDAGATWTPLTDNEDSLAVGAVAVDPQNSNVVYVGTGEGNGDYTSVGILKSTDAGATWTKLAEQQIGRGAVAGLLVSPDNSNILVACVTRANLLQSDDEADPAGNVGGVYRSTDGGVTFTLTDASFCRGIVAVPDDFNTQYYSATGLQGDNGLFRSTDGGQTWAPVDDTVFGENVGRLAIGVSADGSQVYIGGADGNQVVLQESFDSGATWTAERRTTITGNGPNFGEYCEAQCGYDNVIAVDPFDPDNVFYGGVGLYQTTDGADNFSVVGQSITGGPLHVDHHMFVFDPAIEGTAYNGNDGGVYRTTDGGATWTPLNAGLATLQPYNLALHPTDPDIMLTGNQDNGTTRRTGGNVWTEVQGGDGAFSLFDHSNPQTVYASAQNLDFSRSDQGGNPGSFINVSPPTDNSDRPSFIAPVVMDPTDSSVLYAATQRVFRSANSGDSWVATSGDLSGGAGSITNMAIAPSDPAVIYAVTTDGRVQRSDSSGSNFSNVTGGNLPNRFATSVAVHPTDPGTAYVTFSGFDDATPATPGHVFKTTDGGASWTNVSRDLPNIPFGAVEIRPDSPQEVYVGTDVGLFISLDGGGSWTRMSNGLPRAAITDIEVNLTTDILAVATYGRSVWVTSLTGGAPPQIFADGFEAGAR